MYAVLCAFMHHLKFLTMFFVQIARLQLAHFLDPQTIGDFSTSILWVIVTVLFVHSLLIGWNGQRSSKVDEGQGELHLLMLKDKHLFGYAITKVYGSQSDADRQKFWD